MIFVIHFSEYVNLLLTQELPKKLTGHPKQPTLPLVRIRVEYEEDSHQLAIGRFGNNFHNKVANPAEMLLFKKIVKKTIKSENSAMPSLIKDEADGEDDDFDTDHIKSIEEIIKGHFDSMGDEGMELLGKD